jgi:hypothetical protein
MAISGPDPSPILVAARLCGNDNGDSSLDLRINGIDLCRPIFRGRRLLPARFNLPTT